MSNQLVGSSTLVATQRGPTGVSEGLENALLATLPIYKTPSESLWRACELNVYRKVRFESPILEIGCADGSFSSLIFDRVDDAIDINPRSVARYLKVHGKGGIFRRVHCMDARRMTFADSTYRTIFANCVIEHIPELDGVLADSFRALAPGGRFITTVPLRRMSEHLLFRSERYARYRQDALIHTNLHTEGEWIDRFREAGFTSFETSPYISSRTCRLWDTLDAPIGLGWGRYRLSVALRMIDAILPAGLRRYAHQKVAAVLAARIDTNIDEADACAMLLIARK